MDIFIGIVLVLFGLVVTFAGLRVFFVALPIVGFFLGFFVGAIGVQSLFGEGFLSTAVSWIAGIALGVIFALVSYLWWYAGALLAAGAVGASLGTGLMYLLGWNEIGLLMFVFGLVGFAIFFVGALLLNLPVYIVIANTAFAGAFLTIAGVLLLVNQIDYQALGNGAAIAIVNASVVWILAWVALGVVGVVAQLTAVEDVTLPEGRWVAAATT